MLHFKHPGVKRRGCCDLFRGDVFTVTLLGPVRTSMCPPNQLRAVVCRTVNARVSKTTPAFEIIRGLLGFHTEYVPHCCKYNSKRALTTQKQACAHTETVKSKETKIKSKKKPLEPLEWQKMRDREKQMNKKKVWKAFGENKEAESMWSYIQTKKTSQRVSFQSDLFVCQYEDLHTITAHKTTNSIHCILFLHYIRQTDMLYSIIWIYSICAHKHSNDIPEL